MESNPKVSVLFVCMGNICRSPSAEGVFRKLLDQAGIAERIRIDSAGTHAYHVSEAPDLRAQKAAMARGIDISGLRARRFESRDFEIFDYILAMDQQNLDGLLQACPKIFQYKVRLLLSYAPHLNRLDVPDPYYGGSHVFERVLDLLEDGCSALLEVLKHGEI
ncbi:MAG: low molecular weight protein-tyrosine-phosphatase [Methylococcales bacterium]